MPEVSPDANVADGAQLGAGVAVGPGSVIHHAVTIGDQVSIGTNVVIHGGTNVDDRCLIEDGVVLGKRPRLRAGSSAKGTGEPAALLLEEGATVCCGAVVYAGARIGAGVIVGDQTQVRERATIGAGSVIGRASSVDFGARVGERVLIQTGVYITGGSIVEDDVFVGPGVITTNDHTMGRHAPGEPLAGPILRRACRVGGGAVLVPGVEVGEEAFVAAGAVVTADVPARAVVIGVPARVVREVDEGDLIEHWRG